MCHTKIKARTIPSAADITAVKAQKILSKVMEVRNEKDLTKMTKIITDKMNDDDVTAIELAAAFLKMHMGEELEDIPVEVYKPRRARHFGDEKGRRDGRREGRDEHRERSGRAGRDEHREKSSKPGKDERRRKERIGRDGNARNDKGRVDFGVERRLREKREKQKNKKKD